MVNNKNAFRSSVIMGPEKLDSARVQSLKDTSFLDFVDVDPNYHVLKDCFPDFSSDEIFDALENADGDLNKASEYLMRGGENGVTEVQELEPDSVDFKVLSLVEMFPHIEVDIISRTLKESNNDTLKASEALLNHDLLQRFEQEMRIEDSNRVKSDNKTWSSVQHRIYEIAELAEVEISTAKHYYHKNGANIVNALVDMVYNLRKEEDKEVEKNKVVWEKSKENHQSIPKGGRVQNGASGRATPKYKKHIETKPSDSKYVYNENSVEVAELASLVYQDPFLVDINWEFYQEALVFFKGDVTKVIELALFIVEAKATYRDPADVTLDKLNDPSKFNTKPQPPAQFIQVLRKPINDNYKRPESEDDLTAQQIALQRVQLKKCEENNTLDLHRFHVKNARDTTVKALRKWWEDELQARQESGRAHYGSRVRELDPFIVITGKGLHSEGGVSKVRASIKKLLTNSEYNFQEEEARFIVTGLKR